MRLAFNPFARRRTISCSNVSGIVFTREGKYCARAKRDKRFEKDAMLAQGWMKHENN
jgi:hypothetical protein